MANDQLYTEVTAAYSPSSTTQDNEAYLGLPAFATHRPNPLATMSDAPVAYVPRPPDPATGGRTGLVRGLGWSTGLRQPRSMRTLFGGATLVTPTMGVHPADGPVGFSTRTDRLALNVDALYNEWLPSQRTIQESFTNPANTDTHLGG